MREGALAPGRLLGAPPGAWGLPGPGPGPQLSSDEPDSSRGSSPCPSSVDGQWGHCSHCCPCRPRPASSWRRRPLRKAFEGSPPVILPGESRGGVWPLPPPLRRRWLRQPALRLPPEHEPPRLPGPAAAAPSALPTPPAPPLSWPSPQRPSVARARWRPFWRRPPGPWPSLRRGPSSPPPSLPSLGQAPLPAPSPRPPCMQWPPASGGLPRRLPPTHR